MRGGKKKGWAERRECDSFLTLAFARTDGGMTLSGLKACRGSMKEVRILPHFLHSAIFSVSREERQATTMDTNVSIAQPG